VGDEDELRRAVGESAVVPLLCALAHLNGDLDLLDDGLRPNPDSLLEPEGGLSWDQIVECQGVAVEAIGRWRDAGCPPAPPADMDELRRIFAFVVGDANVEGYAEVLREELALEGEDLRRPTWSLPELDPDRTVTVAVVGAGMSGILAAHRLAQAGIDPVVLEKNDDVGGTWLENTYPGCRVDVPSHLYSYSFAQRSWPQHFSDQEVLRGYFRSCADELGVTPRIRFGTEVLAARFDDDAGTWRVEVRDGDGAVEVLEVDAVVSAVGQLNRPSLPDIEGIERFEGPAFHSARWDHDVDLAGKRVAVIGTGASAVQFIPAIAEEAGELVVFQRTPNWFAPTPEYLEDVPAGFARLLEEVPGYASWYRLWQFWRMHEGLLTAARVDPDHQPQDRSVSELNELVRLLLGAYIEAEFDGRPDLLDRVMPQYPPIAKRVIRDDGSWARALRRDDVELVTDPIERITPTGVVTAGGVDHPVDVIVYGTGFQASKFLTPMEVTGRAGVDLHEAWAGDARAYLGVTVPGFPNLFLLYGPNTNIVINGSIIYFSELEVWYLLEALRLLVEGGHRWLDVRPEVHDAFNAEVDEGNRQMVWGAAEVNSWYKNASGRVAQNWPFSLLEYWERTRTVDPADYELG
jgi:4-hydroxyacetophenone monooxygenase